MHVRAIKQDGDDEGAAGARTYMCAGEVEVKVGSMGRLPNGANGTVAGTAGLKISKLST